MEIERREGEIVENDEDIIKNYIKYVQEVTVRYSKSAKLINQNDEITPQDLNYALGSYLDINIMLLGEYQRAKVYKFQVERDFSKWYDKKFIETRRRLFGENESKAKVSVKEIEIDLKYNQSIEYYEWQNKIQEAESKESFLRRLVELYKNFDSVLTTLSNNMRQELKSLSLEGRINSDPNKASNNRIRKEYPKL